MGASIGTTAGKGVSSSLSSDEGQGFVVLAMLEALAPGSLSEVEASVDGDAESLILHRDAAGNVRAWLNVCPHAGRRLDWAPGQFLRGKQGELVCAVHGASFALRLTHRTATASGADRFPRRPRGRGGGG